MNGEIIMDEVVNCHSFLYILLVISFSFLASHLKVCWGYPMNHCLSIKLK